MLNRIMWTLATALFLCLSLCLNCGAQDKKALSVGNEAPPLAGVDTAGQPLSWKHKALAGRATLVYFYSSSTRFSDRGLQELAVAMEKDDRLAARLSVLVVTNSANGEATLQDDLKATSIPFAITVDEDRDKFSSFHVIAYPTVYALSRSNVLLHVIKGYGPLFSTRVLAAAKQATGLISGKEHDELLKHGGILALDKGRVRISRNVRMAKQLIAVGELEAAHSVLAKVLTIGSDHRTGVAMIADVLLRLENTKDARQWVERLRKLDPGFTDLPYLEAELAVLDGKVDEALKILDAASLRSSRADYLRGRAFQSKGDFKAAALLYEAALRELMRKRV